MPGLGYLITNLGAAEMENMLRRTPMMEILVESMPRGQALIEWMQLNNGFLQSSEQNQDEIYCDGSSACHRCFAAWHAQWKFVQEPLHVKSKESTIEINNSARFFTLIIPRLVAVIAILLESCL